MSTLCASWKENGSKYSFKCTHRKNTPSNKTQVLTKSVNMGIEKTGTLNKLLKEVLLLESYFQENKVASGKTVLFVIGLFCTLRLVFFMEMLRFQFYYVQPEKGTSDLKTGFRFSKNFFQS